MKLFRERKSKAKLKISWQTSVKLIGSEAEAQKEAGTSLECTWSRQNTVFIQNIYW